MPHDDMELLLPMDQFEIFENKRLFELNEYNKILGLQKFRIASKKEIGDKISLVLKRETAPNLRLVVSNRRQL